MSDHNETLSIQELVTRSKEAYGLTWADMGHQLGRSEKMMRKLAKGESSGENYRSSLTELYESGQVKHLTPRRRRKDGQLAPVRAKKGAAEKSVAPIDTKGERAPSVRRGRFRHEIQNLAGGNRITTTDMPKTPGSQGRKKGWQSITDELRRISKSQAKKDKRVKVKIVLEDKDGERRIVNIGSKSGYHASDVLNDVRKEHGGSIEEWAAQQIQGAGSRAGSSAPESLDGFRIVQVEQSSFDASRTKPERIAQDATGRRRWGRVGK